jgi:hypothetical protein
MKHVWMLAIAGLLVYACGSSDSSDANGDAPKSMIEQPREDDGKGVGEIKHVDLNDPLDQSLVEKGRGIFEMKCSACHKLSEQRVVGPGMKGLTERRKPEWIMNMILNVDVMLDEDPTARALLKECLVRMPNQNLSQDDARAVLEFAFAIDAE